MGHCLNLCDSASLEEVKEAYEYLANLPIFESEPLPQNGTGLKLRRLDRAVFELLHQRREEAGDVLAYDTVRGTYREGEPLYPGTDISHHDGRFYIVNTCVDCGGNFVITAKDPRGPWSDPVFLPSVEGIDPSLFFDDDGTAWIVNNRAPIGKPRYDGHRALWVERFDPVALKMLGSPTMIVDGGVDPAARPVWIEGPHIFRFDGKYYLTAAEGGTAVAHSQVVFRADRPDGPYRPAPAGVNPILTQRDLDPARAAPITSAGHADLVQLANGDWWATFLATRPYEGDLYNTG
ncbi:hypothetical protein EON80_06985, partial [bacterium]